MTVENFNERIKESFNIPLRTDRKIVAERLIRKYQRNINMLGRWYSPGLIDYGKLNIEGDSISILIKPSTIFSFRPHGKIKYKIMDDSEDRSEVMCEIHPFNGTLPTIILIEIVCIGSWSFISLGLVLAGNFQALYFIMLPWVIAAITTYLNYRQTIKALRKYSKQIISEVDK